MIPAEAVLLTGPEGARIVPLWRWRRARLRGCATGRDAERREEKPRDEDGREE